MTFFFSRRKSSWARWLISSRFTLRWKEKCSEEDKGIQANFPEDRQTVETALLFLTLADWTVGSWSGSKKDAHVPRPG